MKIVFFSSCFVCVACFPRGMGLAFSCLDSCSTDFSRQFIRGSMGWRAEGGDEGRPRTDDVIDSRKRYPGVGSGRIGQSGIAYKGRAAGLTAFCCCFLHSAFGQRWPALVATSLSPATPHSCVLDHTGSSTAFLFGSTRAGVRIALRFSCSVSK